jgi:chloramphenicol 3-O-phosphotransferase
MQQYGHFFLIGALLLLQVGVRVWKSRVTSRETEGPGRAAAVARGAARAAAAPAAGAAGRREAKKDN